jgi:hypothetical protein
MNDRQILEWGLTQKELDELMYSEMASNSEMVITKSLEYIEPKLTYLEWMDKYDLRRK